MSDAFPASTSGTQPEITILITAHNEAERIPASLQAILAQDYPMERVEIILVDDRSTDGTAAEAARLNVPSLRILTLKEKQAGLTTRQSAIDLGMQSARGEIVLLTDAGTRVPREWIRELTGHLGYRDGAVTAPIVFAGTQNFLNTYQTIDALVQFTIYRWLHSRRQPSGLFGANVAVRREAFEQVGGFTAIGFSLVEDAALGEALARNNWSVRYLTEPFVLNPGPNDFGDMLNRARRIATGPTKGYHLCVWSLCLSNLILFAAAMYFPSRILDLLLILRYLVGLLGLGFMLGRYPHYQSGFWLLFYEPLATVLTLWARISNWLKPKWNWGGLEYSKPK